MECPECGNTEFVFEIKGQVTSNDTKSKLTYITLTPGVPAVCTYCKTLIKMKPSTAVNEEENILSDFKLEMKIK